MTDTSTDLSPRQSMLDRLRAPIGFLLIAVVACGGCYYFFLQKKTEYYTSRDARLVARAAQQIGRAVKTGASIVRSAASLKEPKEADGNSPAVAKQPNDLIALYKLEPELADQQRLPSKIFRTITRTKPAGPLSPELTSDGEHRYATRTNDGLLLNFDVM